ncbi:peptidase M23 [Flavobacterium album]|uniref:Peptidase M23 n=1 Tax=Flavobacterium album TaxID=2175091 RepID=A0A2S1QVR2_9FLAO|nr:peptidoglycan DD-metalloendopeptidase family protein [Flavobacterium album]AWH84485.1 peptidase M23 [Flavobacterium album]
MTRFFLTIFLIGCTALSWGQTDQQKKLEQRKAQILKEMKTLQGLVKSESQKEKTVVSKITENIAKIKLSEKLINTTQKQTKLLTDDIYLNQLKINKLNRELKLLKEDYANMVVKAYKNRSEQSRIMFILSSEDFLQAYKRVQYMKQYASFRKIQGDEIRNKTLQLEELNRILGGQKEVKEKLVTQSEQEKEKLQKDKEEQEKLVKAIQKDKKKYASEIKKMQGEAKDIDRKIDKLIKDAIAEANRKAAAKATTAEEKKEIAAAVKAEPNKIALTKEGKLIADNFKANKGRLPWPVKEGYISVPYGDQPHPLDRTLKIHNSGIDITTNPGTAVRAVFAGEVGKIQLIQGSMNKIVYIQHGNYLTVYYNLASINVKSGDKVNANETIGTVATSPSGKTVLKFCVMQNTTSLNPSSWVAQ